MVAWRPFVTDDVLRQELIQTLTLAPDGTHAVYALRTTTHSGYRSTLWSLDLASASATRLTDGRACDTAPELSPDGRQLLFLSDRGGSVQPWVMPAAGGDPAQLAELPGTVRVARWSPSGNQILLLAPSGESRFDIAGPEDRIARRIDDITYRDGAGFSDQCASAWIVDVSGGRARRVTRADHEVFDVTWGPDDNSLFFLADIDHNPGQHPLPQPHQLLLSGGTPTSVPLPTLGGDVVRLAVSRSGRIAVLAYEHANSSWSNVGLFVLHGDRYQRLGGDLDRSFQTLSYGDLVGSGGPVLRWEGDDALLVMLSSEGRNYPCRVTTDNRVSVLASGDIVATDLVSASGRILIVASLAGSAGEIYEVSSQNAVDASRNAREGTAGLPLRQLTSAAHWMQPFRRDAEEYRFTSNSGSEVQAWVLRSDGTDREAPRPTVLHLHGGPHACHGPTPWLEMLALVDAGINVIYPNFQGSGGFGDAYSGSVNGNWGLADGQDVVDIADWAISSGIAQGGRVGVMGCSYGGFMTTWLLGHHPGVFAAGVCENPVTDLVGLYGEGDVGTATSKLAVGPAARLPEDLDKFLERSPFVQLHHNQAPLLFLQADLDLRSPAGQTDLAFAILRTRDVRTEMIRYPDEGHMMLIDGRPDRRMDRINRIVGWFTEHL